MSQQQKRIQLPLIGAGLLGLFAGIYLITWKRFAKPKAAKIIKHPVETQPDDALKYWSEDKMRGAQPAHMPSTNDLKPGKQRPRHS